MKDAARDAILDLACLSRGLPPLSMGPVAALKMISSLPKREKRKTLRKIRKLTKLEIDRRCRDLDDNDRGSFLRGLLDKQVNLNSSQKDVKNNPYVKNQYLVARLIHVKRYMLNTSTQISS